MQYNPDELNEILNIYKAESEEIIQELNDNFMELEKNPSDKTPLKRLLQLVHSLKGASRMLEFNSVQDISHKFEDMLSYWKKDDAVIKAEFFQVIYKICDYLIELVNKSVELKSNYT
ncbi:MAG: Hpt domain-containing protein, partial [Candidatus Gastranaerophilales bacterium]|nr:Hpt domain-containing protein [Candidatus Gastranaerophilales bacterium]